MGKLEIVSAPWSLDWDSQDPDEGDLPSDDDRFPWRVLDKNGDPVVDFCGGLVPSRQEAYLVTAAPDLYAASEALLESLGEYVRQSMYFNPEWKTGIEAVQAALAKARGETE